MLHTARTLCGAHEHGGVGAAGTRAGAKNPLLQQHDCVVCLRRTDLPGLEQRLERVLHLDVVYPVGLVLRGVRHERRFFRFEVRKLPLQPACARTAEE